MRAVILLFMFMLVHLWFDMMNGVLVTLLLMPVVLFGNLIVLVTMFP